MKESFFKVGKLYKYHEQPIELLLKANKYYTTSSEIRFILTFLNSNGEQRTYLNQTEEGYEQA